MLGHKVSQGCAGKFETYVTFRRVATKYKQLAVFRLTRMIENVSTEDFESVINALNTAKPNVVINCIGIVKQDPAASDPIASISINALFPHQHSGFGIA